MWEARCHFLVAVQDDEDCSACDTGISMKTYRVRINFTFFPLAFYWIYNQINLCWDTVGCKINKKVEHSWKQRGRVSVGPRLFKYSFFHRSKPWARIYLAPFLFWVLEEREKLILVIKWRSKLGFTYTIEPVEFIQCCTKTAINLEAAQYRTKLSHLSFKSSVIIADTISSTIYKEQITVP